MSTTTEGTGDIPLTTWERLASNGIAESREGKIDLKTTGDGAENSSRALLTEKITLAQIYEKWGQEFTWYIVPTCTASALIQNRLAF